jgi:hypothetical protein
MRRPPAEMSCALVAILAMTALYGYAMRSGLPRPGGVLGHSLGILGFLMMLSTETLYTLRKRVRRFNWGPMSTWLQVHVFTGIVGPYLVLLHSAGKFNGLAGVTMLLTLVMVLSGFVGRYIYTAAPRTLDGTEIGSAELSARLAGAAGKLKGLTGPAAQAAAGLLREAPPAGALPVLARHLLQWRRGRHVHRVLRPLRGRDRQQAAALEESLTEHYRLQLQINAVVMTRRLLALWHLFHIPLGGVLFTLAFLHIGAALYYSTFLK